MPTPIYHITDVGNLAKIVAAGGLACLNSLRANRTEFVSIAHDSVQDRRGKTTVPCSRGGCLHDYVPFYFAPRSPMLYTISRNNVAHCPQGQDGVIYLVSTVESVRSCGISFAFTDGHGIVAISQFYDDLKHLDKIDWDIMKARYWADTRNDGDRSRRRQAEFLVHSFLPMSLITAVAVRKAVHLASVSSSLRGCQSSVSVQMQPGWYF